LLLYGLDRDGETAFTETLIRQDPAALRALAHQRLEQFHGVEVWDGALCILRLRRRAAQQA
jgi:hypothetical protein